jgi:hypothetical protein
LNVGARLGEFLGGAMQQTDMRIGPLNDLAIKLKHQAAGRRAPPDAGAQS